MKKTNTYRVSPLIQALQIPQTPPNVAYNEKGALSYATTESAVLDWFASGAAMTHESVEKVQAVFAKAFAEDKLLATKVAFYIRDIRGGQGQRDTFRAVLKWLAYHAPSVIRKNLHLVPVYGRWDDLWVLLGTKVEDSVFQLVNKQLCADLEALREDKNVSLLAKWMPSENTSSAETRKQAHNLRQALDLTPVIYRKTLVSLRKKINIVEAAMCAGDWSDINYEHVPSKALKLYRNAFPKHDPEGYAKWKGKAFAGEAKVHAGTLYPYDIIHEVFKGSWDETLELQWKNLPDYFAGQIHNGLFVCDTSGSMTQWTGSSPKNSSVRPLDIAVSISMYGAERMNGPFKDYFITFSAKPELQKIRGASLAEKAENISQAHWEMNTNVQSVFDLVLNKALQAKLEQEYMPDAIYIVSDLQFDHCGFDTRNFDLIKAKFQKAGYKMPLLVFWQVRYNSDKVALKNEKGVAMVSGFSPSILETILKLEQPKEVTPMELMLQKINSERYAPITV